jgi:hypothetical protein
MHSRSEVLIHTSESTVAHPTVAEEASIGVESKEDERGVAGVSGRGGGS